MRIPFASISIASASLLLGCSPGGVAGLERACDRGESNACALAGDHFRGVGDEPAPEPDMERAAKLYDRACVGGSFGGCLSLAHMKLEGNGIERDVAGGVALLDASCAKHQEMACAELGTLYADPDFMDHSPAKAGEYLRQACEYDSNCTDYAYAKAQFQKACDAGDTKSCETASSL